jgi:predicted dithiol-disulfide oxidoreductase (DUF899 family)
MSGELRLWPRSASAGYVAARQELLRAERALSDHVERVAAQRRALPPGPWLADYLFDEGPGRLDEDTPVVPATLPDLFGPHDTLVLYHLMFSPDADSACPMCSMWVDGLHGVAHHLARRTALAVVARAPLPRLREWGRRRGWAGLRLLSSFRTTFNVDMGVEGAQGEQHPAFSVLVRDGGRVRHFYTMQASFSPTERERGIDLLSPVWQVLDLLPQGRGDWYAGNAYAGPSRGGTPSRAAPADV